MRNSRLRIAVICLALAGAPLPSHADDKPAAVLVRAKVKSVEKKERDGSVPAVIEITEVLVGPPEIKGRRFRDYHVKEGNSFAYTDTPFVVDEEGLWTLREEKGDLHPVADPNLPIAYRCRKVDCERYDQMVRLAEAVERVQKLKTEERDTAIQGLIANPTPEISRWAVWTLSRSANSPTARKFFDVFAENPDRRLPLAAQVEIDGVLCHRDEGAWHLSKIRAELLREWVGGKADEYHAKLILSHFSSVHQRRELQDEQMVALVRKAAENEAWPREVRFSAIDEVGRAASRGVNDDANTAGFDWLFDQIKNNKEVEGRRSAAVSLWQLPLYPARLKAVEEHLANEKDEKVAKALRASVKKAKE